MNVSRLAKTTLFALFWANFLNFFDRQVVASLAPLLQEYWQLSDYQVGLLATAFEVTYALAPLPVAVLADRWLRRRVVALALFVWSGAMALTGAAGSFTLLLLGRAGLGLGEASYGPSALAWLSDLFPPSHRSRAVGIHDLALMIGSAAGYALGGVLGKALGWRPVFFLATLPGLLLAAVVWALPEPRRGQADYQFLGLEDTDSPRPAIPFLTALRQLLAVPTLVVTYAVAVLINLATAGIIYWLPSFAVRLHGLDAAQAGLGIGVLTVVTGAAGVLVAAPRPAGCSPCRSATCWAFPWPWLPSWSPIRWPFSSWRPWLSFSLLSTFPALRPSSTRSPARNCAPPPWVCTC